jgi:large repetitive protein
LRRVRSHCSLQKTLPNTCNDGYSRVYFNILSYASQVNLLRYRTSADASLGYLFVSTSGKLGLRDDVAATTTTSATSVSAGWHSLELHLTINGTSSVTEVWLDGVKVNDLSLTANWGTTPIGRFQIGEVQNARTYNVVFDDAVFDIQRVGP